MTDVLTRTDHDRISLNRPAVTTIIRPSDADLSALASLIHRGIRVGNEDVERDHHLHELITKPWGHEYRVYADDFIDMWQLLIHAGQSTSMHAHPRKTTYLLCLDGTGATTTLSGTIEVSKGMVLRIERGAFHSTQNVSASDPLMLIEVETPRNKFDLVRLRDWYERCGKGYERDSVDHVIVSKRLPFLPNARMCKRSPCGTLAFEVVSGMDTYYRRYSAGTYLVPLGVSGILFDDIRILTDDPADERKPDLDMYYVGVRRVA